MGHSRDGNYYANSPNRAKIKHVQDFMSVPVIYNFDEEPVLKSNLSKILCLSLLSITLMKNQC